MNQFETKKDKSEKISIIKNFEKLHNTSIRLQRPDGLKSEEEEPDNYDISYSFDRSDASVDDKQYNPNPF